MNSLNKLKDAVLNKQRFNSSEIYFNNALSTKAKLDELNKRCEELQKENMETHKLLDQLEEVTVVTLQEFNENIIEKLDKVQRRSRQNEFEVKSATNQNKIEKFKGQEKCTIFDTKDIR